MNRKREDYDNSFPSEEKLRIDLVWDMIRCSSQVLMRDRNPSSNTNFVTTPNELVRELTTDCPLTVMYKKITFHEYVPEKIPTDQYHKMTEVRKGEVLPIILVVSGCAIKMTLYIWMTSNAVDFTVAFGKPQPVLRSAEGVVVPVGMQWTTKSTFQVVQRASSYIPIDYVAQNDTIFWTFGNTWEVLAGPEANNTAVVAANQKVWENYNLVSGKPSMFRKHMNEVKFKVLENQTNTKDHKVLDLCCGRGTDVEKWQRYGARLVTFADMSMNSLNNAKGRYDGFGCRRSYDAEFVSVDINNIVLDGKYDLIWCSFGVQYVIPTLESWDKFMTSIYEHLTDEGRVVFVYPDGEMISDGLSRGAVYPKGNYMFSYARAKNVVKVKVMGCYSECPEYLVCKSIFTRYGFEVSDNIVGSWLHDVRMTSPECELIRVCQLTRKPSTLKFKKMGPPWKMKKYERDMCVTVPLSNNGKPNVIFPSTSTMTNKEKSRFRLHGLNLGELAWVLREWGYTGVIGKKVRCTDKARNFVKIRSRDDTRAQLLYQMGLID